MLFGIETRRLIIEIQELVIIIDQIVLDLLEEMSDRLLHRYLIELHLTCQL